MPQMGQAPQAVQSSRGDEDTQVPATFLRGTYGGGHLPGGRVAEAVRIDMWEGVAQRSVADMTPTISRHGDVDNPAQHQLLLAHGG